MTAGGDECAAKVQSEILRRAQNDTGRGRMGSENLQGLREEIDLFVKIRNTIAGIVGVLTDMNALTAERPQGSNFHELLEALEARLAE